MSSQLSILSEGGIIFIIFVNRVLKIHNKADVNVNAIYNFCLWPQKGPMKCVLPRRSVSRKSPVELWSSLQAWD